MVSPLPHHISIVSRLFILFSLLLFSLSSPISTPLLSAHAFLLKRNLDSLNPPSDPSSSSPSLSIFSSLSLPSSPRENTHVSIPHIRPSLPLQTLPLLLLLKKRSSPLRSSSSSSRRLLPLLYLSPSSLLSSLRLRSSSPQCGKNDGEEISLQARRRKGGGGEILASSSSACVRDFFSSLGSRDFPSPVYRQRKTISLSHIRGKLALFFHQFVSTSFLFPSSYSLLSSHHPSFYPHSLSSSLSSSSLPSSSPPSSSSPSSISSPSSPPSSLSSSPPPPSPLPSSPPSSLPSSPPSSLPSSSLSLETLPVSPSSASCVSSLLSLPQTNLLLLVSYDGSHFSGWTSNLSIKERCLLLYPTLLKKLQTNSSSHYKFFAPSSSSSSAETERSLQASHRSAYKRTTCLPSSSSSLQHDDRSAAYNSSVPSSSSVFCLKSVNSKKEKERMKKRGKGGQDEEQGEEERRGISKIRTVEGVLREAFAMIHPLSRKRQRDLSLQLFSCSSSFGQSEETESHSIDEKERLHALEKKKEKERDREVGIAEGEKERRTEREGEEEIEGHGQEGIDREMKNEERVKTRERRRRRRSERGRQEGGGGEEEREKDSLREIEDDEFYHDFLDRRKREYESLVQAVKQAEEEEEEEEEGDLLHLPETKTKKKKPLIAPPIILRPASRTDRGVHALGSVCQYVSYHHALEISLESFVTAANHRLPPDVRILAAIDLNELAKHKEGREFFETFHRNEDKQTKKEKKGEISGVREEEEERGSVNGVEETQEKVVDAKEEEEAKNEVEKKKREEGRDKKETSTVNGTDDLKEEEKKKKIAKNEGDNSTEEIQSRETHFSPYHSFSSSSPSSPSSSSRSSSSSFGHSDRGLDVMPTIYRLVRGKHYTYFLSFAETDHPLLRHYTWSIPRDPRIRNMALYERNTSPQKRERRRRGSDEVQEESVDEGREEGRNDERERKIQRKEAYRDMTRWRRERDVDTKEASLSLDLEREKKEEDEEEREKDRRRNAWSSSAAFSVKDEGWNLYRDVFSFDLENMRKAAELMTGSHSFKAFRCEYKGKEREKRRRKGEEESICHMEQLAITPLRFMPWPESILGDDEERCRHLPYLPSLSSSSSSFFSSSSSSSSETQPFHPSPRSSSRVFSPGVAEAVFSLSPGSSSSSSSSFLPKKKVEEEEERDGDPSSAKRSSSSHLPQGLRIDVVGNRFLYKMIRKMVGGLVQVGLGRLSLEDIRHALIHGKLPPVPPSSCVKEKDDKEEETEARVRSRRRRDEGILCAPARGLVLQRVFLPSFLERLFYQ